VFTCIPRDEDQRLLMAEVFRLLAPGGVVYVSDFLLHSDERNLLRYRKHCERFGTFGVFEEGGAVFRHHTLESLPKRRSEALRGEDQAGQSRDGMPLPRKEAGAVERGLGA
jgi:hypothetical protein